MSHPAPPRSWFFLILLPGMLGTLLTLSAAQGTADTSDAGPRMRNHSSKPALAPAAPNYSIFSQRTLTKERRRQVPDVIQLLGDDELKVRILAARELISVGKPAVPALQAGAKDRNLAIVQRPAMLDNHGGRRRSARGRASSPGGFPASRGQQDLARLLAQRRR